MKKLLIALCAASTLAVYAENSEAAEAEMEKNEAPIFWGFGASGIYSGYMLYGSLVNSEPTWQTYLEVNANLNIADYNLGYLGVGFWCNTDITDKRRNSYGQMFNETDPNVHWGRTFWFDDDQTWGLDYRTSVIWYIYPHHLYQKHKNYGKTDTTMDWNHSFELKNPYVIPFFTWVHEYHENNADLWEFGLKRTFAIGDSLTVTPSVTSVIRDHRYNWCFATAGFNEFHNGGWATTRFGADANYAITKNFGLFAKVYFCTTVDGDLRDAADNGKGDAYGQYKDFVWGGVGVTFNF